MGMKRWGFVDEMRASLRMAVACYGAAGMRSSKTCFLNAAPSRNLRWPRLPQATSDLFVLKMLSAD